MRPAVVLNVPREADRRLRVNAGVVRDDAILHGLFEFVLELSILDLLSAKRKIVVLL